MTTAYLLLRLDNGEPTQISIFSESNPTTIGDTEYIKLLSCEAESYALAEQIVKLQALTIAHLFTHLIDARLLKASEFEKMNERIEWLECLEAAGVDNWPGMDDASALLNGEEI